MNTQNKWRLRGHRTRDKAQVIRSDNQRRLPVTSPTLYPKPHHVCPVSEPIVRFDNRIYELLSIFTDRLTRLENYVYNVSDRLKRNQYREDNLPGAETLWRQIQLGKAGEFREGSSVSRNQTRKNHRGYYRDDPVESQGRPRTIDITQCRYCSS
jgi:hypothetical protein